MCINIILTQLAEVSEFTQLIARHSYSNTAHHTNTSQECSDDAAVCTVTYTLQHVWNVHFKYPRVRYKALTSGSQYQVMTVSVQSVRDSNLFETIL